MFTLSYQHWQKEGSQHSAHGAGNREQDMVSLTGLWDFLGELEATPKQAHDLLNCRCIGQEAYKQFASHKILVLSSTSASNRKKTVDYIHYNKGTETEIQSCWEGEKD